MKRETIQAEYLSTISWLGNNIVDWALGGMSYSMNGETAKLYEANYIFNWGGAINSHDGTYSFIYQRLGTKGLLLKNGKILREINRPFYCANVYEYPAAFVTLKNKTYLIHCPIDYNYLDFENVETGELITKVKGRKPQGVFHSRLEVSPDNNFLISRGWEWHPVDVINVFNIKDCLKKPKLLDNATLIPDVGTELSTASFMDTGKVLIGSSGEVYQKAKIDKLPPKNIAVWDLITNQLSRPVEVKPEFGNLFSINDDFAWDLFKYPKIININTGEVIEENKEIDSGEQRSSIIHQLDNLPQIIFNRQTKQIAIAGKDKIEILTPEL